MKIKKNYWLLSTTEKKACIYIFFISLFVMSSLLLANLLYSDDYTRVTTGETLWNDNGRPLASLFSILLQLGKPLTDISPFPQLLAIAIYTLSAIYLGKLFQVENLLLLTLSGAIFVLNPFNLQNFVFVFDSFPMSLAILASTIAVLSIKFSLQNNFQVQGTLFSFILLLSTLCLYQSATSVYLVTITFYALFWLLNKPLQQARVIKFFFYSIISLFIALIAYIPIKKYYVTNEYNLHHSEIISFSEAPQAIINNLIGFWYNIQILLGNTNIILSLIYCLFFIIFISIVLTVIAIKKKKTLNFQLNPITQCLLFFSVVFYCLLLIITPLGMMLFLKYPIFAPRTMMGFSTFVGICCLFLSRQLLVNQFPKLVKYCWVSFLCVIILAFTNVSLTLGNVLYAQNIQDETIATVLISDLEEIIPQLSTSPQPPILVILNSLEYTYINSEAYKKYPLLKSINWYYLKSNQIQFYTKLETLGFKFIRPDPNYNNHVFKGTNNQFIPKTKAILNRPLYKVYFESFPPKDMLVVVLQNPQI